MTYGLHGVGKSGQWLVDILDMIPDAGEAVGEACYGLVVAGPAMELQLGPVTLSMLWDILAFLRRGKEGDYWLDIPGHFGGGMRWTVHDERLYVQAHSSDTGYSDLLAAYVSMEDKQDLALALADAMQDAGMQEA